ncbi:MAG: RDD family protein [Acidimicrobiaceae bacterium]|nr:RDD family protein [Acidimicrobiaceae bacterium]
MTVVISDLAARQSAKRSAVIAHSYATTLGAPQLRLGQTPAKVLLNLRVVDAGPLRPVGFARMFRVREIVAGAVAGFAIPLTLGVLLFMPFWDRRNQNLWDKISSTYVVLDPSDAWDTKPDLPR